jgi:hypothetical protein
MSAAREGGSFLCSFAPLLHHLDSVCAPDFSITEIMQSPHNAVLSVFAADCSVLVSDPVNDYGSEGSGFDFWRARHCISPVALRLQGFAILQDLIIFRKLHHFLHHLRRHYLLCVFHHLVGYPDIISERR